MAKRIHTLRAKPGQIRVGWARPEPGEDPDLVYAYGGRGASKTDTHLLAHAFETPDPSTGKSLAVELRERGYDLTTLKFSIEKSTQATGVDSNA